MSGRPMSRVRAGFTIIEMLVAVLVFSTVMAVAFSFLMAQNQGYRKGTEWLSVLQNLRYAVQTLEQDLRTAGTNLLPGQPELVYADEYVVAFNADYASNVANDFFAVYYDPDAPTGQVTALRSEITIPETSFRYPDTVYTDQSGSASPGELIVFFFALDESTTRTDDYALYRQVNSAEPELVARNLLQAQGKNKNFTVPFFRYYRSNSTSVDSFGSADLPLRHTVPIHGSAADTGSVARIDSIDAIRITLDATNGLEEEMERSYGITRVIRLPNLGLSRVRVCGSRPLLGTTISATPVVIQAGEVAVDLAWNPGTDDGGGEGDVIRYVLYRKVGLGASDWGDPFRSFPAGQDIYSYRDTEVVAGQTYQYAVAAQDCTPQLSDLSAPAVVAIPIS
jgi:prepilin-type N-terminal cleavage/methylation domain-containing protein